MLFHRPGTIEITFLLLRSDLRLTYASGPSLFYRRMLHRYNAQSTHTKDSNLRRDLNVVSISAARLRPNASHAIQISTRCTFCRNGRINDLLLGTQKRYLRALNIIITAMMIMIA